VNKGAEALLFTACSEISKRVPNIEFWAELQPYDFQNATEQSLLPVREMHLENRISKLMVKKRVQSIVGRAQKLLGPLIEWGYRPVCSRDVPIFDATIDVSGYTYHDAGISRMLNVIFYMRHQPNPYIFLPQAWGPVRTLESRYWMKRMLRQATAIYSRDRVSSEYLQECNVENFLEAPDIALAFGQNAETQDVPEYLESTLLGEDAVIGVAPNMRVYERTPGDGEENQYICLLIALCRHCLEQLGVSVVLIANEIHPGNNVRDDQDLCELLHKQIAHPQCFYRRQYCSAETVRNIIGHVDLLIGSRFHTLIFALSQCVPVMALGWSHKYRELLQSFGIEECSMEHDDVHKSDDGVQILNDVWRMRENQKQNIRDRLRLRLGALDKVFDSIAREIC